MHATISTGTAAPAVAADDFEVDRDLIHQRISNGARQHGEESEPDHEVGDLQDVLRLTLARLTPAQLCDLAQDVGVLGVIFGLGPSALVRELPGVDEVGGAAALARGLFARCYQVEYDPAYYGGDYSRVGTLALVPEALVKRFGSVAAAFQAHTGYNPVHIVHFSEDERYAADGTPISQ